MDKVNLIKVFIASPGDTTKYREKVKELIYQWNISHVGINLKFNTILIPILWEYSSSPVYSYESGQQVLNKRLLLNCDMLIGIFNKKLGMPVDGYESGTDEEISLFYGSKKRSTGVFFVDTKDKLNQSEADEFIRLRDYKKETKKGLHAVFSERAINNFLSSEVNELLAAKESETDKTPNNLKNTSTEQNDFSNTKGLQLVLERRDVRINKTIKANAIFKDDQYIVLHGSMIDPVNSPNISKRLAYLRNSSNIDNQGILREDMIFNSPSNAASFVIGNSANGKVAWKLMDGRTLKEYQEEENNNK